MCLNVVSVCVMCADCTCRDMCVHKTANVTVSIHNIVSRLLRQKHKLSI